jgi:branched-subunit amino acid ABC-type transport system permease component
MEAFIQQLINGLSLGAIYALIALGYNLIFGVMNILTFAHGTVVMIGAYTVLIAHEKLGIDFAVAVVLGLAVATLTGLLVERVAVRPIRNNPWAVIIATFGMAIVIEHAMRQYKDIPARPVPFPSPFEHTYFYLFEGARVSLLQLGIFSIGLVLMIGLLLLIYRTKMGMAIRAVAQSPLIAETMGINLRKVAIYSFAIASVVGGAVGILYAIYYQSIYIHVGSQFLGLKGLVIVIVAGAGNIPGSLITGLMLGVLEALTIGYIGSEVRDLVAYSTLFLVLIFRPSGLFGEQARVEFKV